MSPKSLSQHELDLPVHIWHCDRGESSSTPVAACGSCYYGYTEAFCGHQ